MHAVTDDGLSLSISTKIERTYVIATLSGEIDIAGAPALREQLLGLLRPAPSRLVLDLSAVSYADASGVAVLVGTGRRARLLGGFLRLAAPTPQVTEVLRLTGVDRHLDVFRTVQAAMTGPASGKDRHGIAAARLGGPAPAWQSADPEELRLAIAAVLLHAGEWRDADPCRQVTPALQALAWAFSGTDHAALTQAAQALLLVLARRPLTYSPAVAATASRLRRLLQPGPPALADNQQHGAAR